MPTPSLDESILRSLDTPASLASVWIRTATPRSKHAPTQGAVADALDRLVRAGLVVQHRDLFARKAA